MLVAAIITPPGLKTLVLVTIPLYLLYDVSVRIAYTFKIEVQFFGVENRHPSL